VASFMSMPLAEPSYQANTTGARLAGEESEPEDVDQTPRQTSATTIARFLATGCLNGATADAGRREETDRLGESPPAMRGDRTAGRANLPAHV
jgi:hypothetical protein